MTHPVPEWADTQVPAESLDPQGFSRRGLMRRAGLFRAGFAAASLPLPALAHGRGHGQGWGGGHHGPGHGHGAHGHAPDLVYLVGDHHKHTVYSHDAKYTFSQIA